MIRDEPTEPTTKDRIAELQMQYIEAKQEVYDAQRAITAYEEVIDDNKAVMAETKAAIKSLGGKCEEGIEQW